MTFARQIAIGATAASLVPILFAALIFANLKEGTRKRQQILRAQEALVQTALLERLLIDMETGVRGFRIKGQEVFLEPYNDAVAQYGAVRSRLDAVLGSEEERKMLREIGERAERWRREFVEPRIAAIRASPPVATEHGILLAVLPESLDTEAGKQRTDALRAMFDELGSLQRKRGERLIAERTQTDTDLSRLLWAGALGFSLLLFAGSIYLLRLFDRRTGVLFAGIAAAERGEYRPVALPGSDEPARIADAFNRMVAAVGRSDEELRRRAEELQESRENLASILESIGEGVVVADRNGKFTVFNPAAERILGLGVTATGPDEWPVTYGVFLPDGVTPFPAEEQPLARAIRGESSNDVEIHIRNPRVPAGTSISVSGRPIRYGNGSLRGGVVVFRDITQRQRAEKKFRSLVESAPDAMVIVDGGGRIVIVNGPAERLFRYSREELVGQPIEMLVPTRLRDRHLGHRSSYLAEPRAREMGTGLELYGLRKDGTEFPVEISLSPLETDEGILVSSAIRDITQRKKTDQVLAERRVELEAANQELEAFAYSVSHDLRAPLRAIDGFSQVLAEDFSEKLGPEGQSPLLRIRAATKRMGHLIDDLLKLSQVTRAEIRRERVNLSSLARRAAEEAQRREPERSVEITVAEGAVVEGDPRLLALVLENLIGNAFKFTGKKPDPRVEFGIDRGGASPVYFVKDNGAGFDMAYAGKLFGAFQRLHAATEFQGTGIGLATVQRILHRHGGRVWVEAAVDQGATFYFSL